jgi:8-oxo-dGTP diphosphatase
LIKKEASGRDARAPVRVVAALLVRKDAVLVQQREPGGPRGLLWEFPGGKVEPGETDADALVRECREELAIEIEVGPVFAETRHAYPDLEVTLVLHECRLISGDPKKLSAHDLRWVAVSELSKLPFLPADVPLVSEIVRRLR